MAKSKAELLREAKKAGAIPEDAGEDEFTVSQLENILSPERVAWEGSLSSSVPLVGPDGHVHLSQEDIDARG